jgi:hypothetical protein
MVQIDSQVLVHYIQKFMRDDRCRRRQMSLDDRGLVYRFVSYNSIWLTTPSSSIDSQGMENHNDQPYFLQALGLTFALSNLHPE